MNTRPLNETSFTSAALTHELVVTLVAAAPGGLPPTVLKETAIFLRKSGGKGLRTAWLAETEAADIYCAGFNVDELRQKVATQLKEAPLDVIVQPVVTRRKKLLLADMESTIIEQEMLDELAALIGVGEEVAAITRRAMNGEIDFSGALAARVALLKGQPEKLLSEAASRMTFMPGAVELIETLKAQGVACWLVSGGFTCFAEPIAAKLGFDRVYANTLLIADGIITGEVEHPILDKTAKQVILEKGCAERQISVRDAMTVGDGANDIPMLTLANKEGGLGVAYHAKPNVRAVIPNQANVADLRLLLFAQGYGKPKPVPEANGNGSTSGYSPY